MDPNEGRLSDRATLVAIARKAMTERGLEPDFPAEALDEVRAFGASIPPTADLRDLRDRLWSSIDNEDSRDLDQLTVAEALGSGQVRILVAIADVDVAVRRGSALDAHAAHNTTSVYTPAAVFPMLPETLSTDLTSLNEAQDRIAVVADMIFSAEGVLTKSELYRAHVRNHAKLAYSSVAAWLEGESPPPPAVASLRGLDENLRLQDRVAQQLVGLRHVRGALTLETSEARPVFSGDTVSTLQLEQKNRGRQLIEEFMIATNGLSAAYLAERNFPSFRRVLRAPERWDRLVELAAGYDFRLPTQPDSAALESFLLQRRRDDPGTFANVSLAVVKLIGKGEYALVEAGASPSLHFGLAVQGYTHSTAPNRRYPDLITQRLLKAAMSGAPLPYSVPELTALAQHCTKREDDASKVERQVRKSAAAVLLVGRIGEIFDAIVTGAGPKGTWVRLFQPPVEGLLQRGFDRLDVGDRLRVKLVQADIQRGFIDFAPALAARDGEGPSRPTA